MLRRLLWLILLALALLVLLGLMAAQAEAPYRPLSAIAPQAADLPSAPAAGLDRSGEAEPLQGERQTAQSGALPLPEAPPLRTAYHRRCFSAFHYPDRAG